MPRHFLFFLLAATGLPLHAQTRGVATSLEAIRQTTRPDTIAVIDLGNRDIVRKPVFGKDSSIIGVDIINNGWQQIPPEIARCVNAKKLFLGSHRITGIPRWLSRMDSLAVLDVSLNPLRVRSVKFKRNRHIKTINFSACGFKQSPKKLRKNKRLEQLVFNDNDFSEFPKALCRIKTLRELSFYRNQLSQLPGQFRRLKSLRVIDLYYNRFKQFPVVLHTIKSQEVLALSYNQLEQIPDQISGLTQLKEIYLRGNRLTTLPETLRQMPSVRKMYISENAFTYVPEVIFGMPGLEELDVSGNPALNGFRQALPK